MALELIEHHILVNAVAPGAIATPMNDMDDSDIEPIGTLDPYRPTGFYA